MSAQPDLTHLVVGSFDMLHVGHVRQLAEAGADGARVVVGVVGDELVEQLHGAAPFMPESERAELVAELSTVYAAEIITSTDLRVVIGEHEIGDVALEPTLPADLFETGDLVSRPLPALAQSSSPILSAALTMRLPAPVEGISA